MRKNVPRKHLMVYDIWLNSHKKKNCKIISTGRTTRIILPKTQHILAKDFLNGFELSVLRSVQLDADKWLEKNNGYVDTFVKDRLNRRIKYKNISIKCLKRNIDKVVHCFDLKAAYPTLMRNKNIISDKTYEKLLQVEKEKRQWLIGSIGSTKLIKQWINGKRVLFYDNDGKEKDFYYDVNDTKVVWQWIAYEVDRFMQELFSYFYNYKIHVKRGFLNNSMESEKNEYFESNFLSLAYYVDCIFILCDSEDFMRIIIDDLSEKVFKEGYSYGYSKLLLKDFDIMKKSITLADVNNTEETKKYLLTDNGYYVNSKLICND